MSKAAAGHDASAVRTAPAIRHVRIDRDLRPFLVIWEATRACALACVHCRAHAQPLRDPRELTTDQAKQLMDQVADFGKPPPIFVITGGDPFEREDLIELVTYGRSIGLPVAVSPSGTERLTRQALDDLHQAGASALSLSVDGASAATHDAFRQIPGTFERTLAGWQWAREMGLRVQINTTVSRRNLHELADIAKLVADFGAMTWSGFLLVPTGRGHDLDQPAADEIEDVLNFFYDMGDVVPTRTTEGHHFRRVVLQREQLAAESLDHVAALGLGELYQELTDRSQVLGLTRSVRSRRAPLNVSSANGFVFISHHGQVQPSGFLPLSAGNIKDQPLAIIYAASDLFRQLRDTRNLKGKCGECEFVAVCGGSRARAYGATGTLDASDPMCAYVPCFAVTAPTR